jgi:hypothetical protein
MSFLRNKETSERRKVVIAYLDIGFAKQYPSAVFLQAFPEVIIPHPGSPKPVLSK